MRRAIAGLLVLLAMCAMGQVPMAPAQMLVVNGRPDSRDTTPPSAPGNATVSGITSSSATCTWTAATDNVGIARYELYYGLGNGSGQVQTSLGLYGITSDLSLTMTGLTENQEYYCRPQAVDANENFTPAAARTFFDTLAQVSDEQPAAGDFFVNNAVGAGCSDAGDGLARTAAGGLEPWCSPNKCNAITAAASGHRTCWIDASGSYTTNHILDFVNPGASDSRRVRVCAIGGNVTLTNPTAPDITNIIRNDTDYSQYGGCGTSLLAYDGGVTWGTGGGQAQKGSLNGGQTMPEDVANIMLGIEVTADHGIIDVSGHNTGTWTCIYITSTVDDLTLRGDFGGCGTPFHTDGADSGDQIWQAAAMATSATVYLDGCSRSTGNRFTHPGHGSGHHEGGILQAGCGLYSGYWGDVATFSDANPDGNRAFEMTRSLNHSNYYALIVNRAGKPQDSDWSEGFKVEGRCNSVSMSLVRNIHAHGFILHHADDAANGEDWNHTAECAYVANVTFKNLGGPVIEGREWGGPGSLCEVECRFLNFVVDGASQNTACCNDTGNWDDEIIHFVLEAGDQWRPKFDFLGWTITTPDGTCNSAYITIFGGDGPGRRTVDYYNTNFPDDVDIDCVVAINFVNELAASADQSLATYEANWLPTSSSALDNAYPLATATNAGTGSTNLCLNYVTPFPDPNLRGRPAYGPFAASGFIIRPHGSSGANWEYTDRTVTTYGAHAGCLTLASGQTWSVGQQFGFGYTGTALAANRGAVP